MTADQLLQFVSQSLFVFIFVVVSIQALHRPRRANIDIALLFGTLSLIVAEGWVVEALSIKSNGLLTVATEILIMALPYLLLRLVDDFSDVPRVVLNAATAGFVATVVTLIAVRSPQPLLLTFLYVAYFLFFSIYVSAAFVQAARQSSGVTRRRMQAVAGGTFALGLAIVALGLSAAPGVLGRISFLLSQLFGLLCGMSFFVGFAPPVWLRRAWQEPEVRAFLGRAARLPRLPDTQAIVSELERGAASSLGTTSATIALWDEAAGLLHGSVHGTPYTQVPGQGIAGRAFAGQVALFAADATAADPDNADRYRQYGATAILAAPITAGDKRLGVFVVVAQRTPIFADDDLVLVKLLADQAAVILESRSLIDEAAKVRAREEATHLKDDFLSAAAHDLKTPLTALVAQAQILEYRSQRNPDAPADLKGIQRMVTETQRLKSLILELLDVSRVEHGNMVGIREYVDLDVIAAEVCARQTTSRHRCLLQSAGPVTATVDRIRVTQLMENLVENAVKYSPDGGDITVTLWREADMACMTVADSGIGIPAADLPHLFDRFHRGTNVDDRRFAGMGLGLYICWGIVEQHGGRIWATSSGSKHGSTFHVVLPATTPLAGSPSLGEAQEIEHAEGALLLTENAST